MKYTHIPLGESLPPSLLKEVSDSAERFKAETIGLLQGGRSKEREASLWSAKFVAKAMNRLSLNFKAIDPAESGFWTEIRDCTTVFNCLHGQHGEDGEIQGVLNALGKPYTGSSILASAIGMDKIVFKHCVRSLSATTPDWWDCQINDDLSFPLILKPRSEGGSIGIKYISNTDELTKALLEIRPDEFFLERFIHGRILTFACIEIFGVFYTIHPLEIQLTKGQVFYDYETKYGIGGIEADLATNLDPSLLGDAIGSIRRMITTFKIKGCCRFDVILTDDSVYFLEMNSIPGLQPEGNFFSSLRQMGMEYDQMILTILGSASPCEQKTKVCYA